MTHGCMTLELEPIVDLDTLALLSGPTSPIAAPRFGSDGTGLHADQQSHGAVPEVTAVRVEETSNDELTSMNWAESTVSPTNMGRSPSMRELYGLCETSAEIGDFLNQVHSPTSNRCGVTSPTSVLDVPVVKKRKRGDNGNKVPKDPDPMCELGNMQNLQAKLAHLSQLTNMPLDIGKIPCHKNRKVSGVNKSNKNKYDARYITRLARPGSAGGVFYNVYISSYNYAEDAAAAVALLNASLETTIRTIVNGQECYLPYFQYLQLLGENDQRQEKQKLRETVVKHVRTMMEHFNCGMQPVQAHVNWEIAAAHANVAIASA